MDTEEELPWGKIYQATGECVHAWSGVEAVLTTLFVTLHDRVPDDWEDPLRATFEAVISFDVRLSMLMATVNADHRCGEYREPFTSLKNKLTRSYKQRHEVAHFTLVGHGMEGPGIPGLTIKPFFTMASFLKQTGKPVLTVKDIKARAISFHDLATRIHWHTLYIRQKRGLPVADSARIDDPALLLQSLSGPAPTNL